MVDLSYERPDGAGVCRVPQFFAGYVSNGNLPGSAFQVAAEYRNACGTIYKVPIDTNILFYVERVLFFAELFVLFPWLKIKMKDDLEAWRERRFPPPSQKDT